jgi:hypothetical protein
MGSDVEPLVSEDVGPDEEWEYPYFSSAIRSRNAVKFKITGVTDDAIEDVINDRLRKAGAQGRDRLLEIFWNRDGATMNVMLSPVADVDGLVKKIDFGTVVARKGRRILVEAKKEWTDDDFRFGFDPERTIRLKIIGVTDSATEEAIKEKLEETMGSSGFYPRSWDKMAGTVTADFAPVDDVETFVKKLDFVGTVTVTNIRGRRVEVKVGGATR